MYIIGIDIASRNSGISVLNENKCLIEYIDIKLKAIYKYKNDIEYFNTLKEEIEKKLFFNDLLNNECVVVIEHNVRNETLTKVLGMWVALLSRLNIKEFVYKETNEWYVKNLKLGGGKDRRVLRKLKAKEYFYKKNPRITWEISEDIADSFCIAMSWFVGGK